jgi:uncharacterized membrane protein
VESPTKKPKLINRSMPMVATALCAIALVAILAVTAFHVYRGFAEGSRMELTFKDSPPTD